MLVITAKDIAQKLASQAEQYARWLLPGGHKDGGNWCAGSVDGEAGGSLRVQITGTKAGIFADFAGSDKGDLLNLTAAVRRVPLKEAIKIAKEWLGIRDFEQVNPKKTYSKPKLNGATTIKQDSAVKQYLMEERGLNILTTTAFRVTEYEGKDGPEYVLPSYSPDGELENIKYIAVKRDPKGKKIVRQTGGCAPALFGWQVVPGEARELIITEGELDAMTWHQMGFPAVSIPWGAGNDDWIDYEWETLQQFDTIWLHYDNDKDGEKNVPKVAQRLGLHRCLLIKMPGYKDANEALQKHQEEDFFAAAIAGATVMAPEEIKRPTQFRDRVMEKFYPKDGIKPGFWPSLFMRKLGMRPGEVTLWTGISGHGKALDIRTDIPTTTGWKKMEEVVIGDKLFDESGMPCNVVAVTDVMEGRPCCELIFSDGTTIICDESHEWKVSTCQSRTSIRNAKAKGRDIPRQLKKRGTDQSWKRTGQVIKTAKSICDSLFVMEGSWTGHRDYAVDVAKGLVLPESVLPIDPYCLGAWLGDGTSRTGQITSNDPEILEWFRRAGFCAFKNKAKYLWRVTPLQRMLRRCGLLQNKHIPKEYLRASYGQRLALLQGLMDTDGHATNYGRCEFCNTNKRLANEVLELVCSLGLQARLITGRAMLRGKDCGEKYRVTFTPDIPVFRLFRKLAKLKCNISVRIKQRFIQRASAAPAVPVKCIQVDSPSRLFLCTKAFIPTHNSVLLLQTIVESLLAGERAAVASMEMRGEQTLHRMICQSESRAIIPAQDIDSILSWMSSRLWIYDIMGNVNPDKLLALMEYSYARHGVTQFVIDSLMKCGIDSDDYNSQRMFLNSICDLARKYEVHINLVAHARKGKDESQAPGKLDVKGSSDIINQPDNIVSVYRNKEKEEKCRKSHADPQENQDDPDTITFCDKQRETGDEFASPLRFFKHCYAYNLFGALSPPNLSIMARIEQERQIEASFEEIPEPEPTEAPA